MKAIHVNREQTGHASFPDTVSRLVEISALALVMLYAYAGTSPDMIGSHVSSKELVLVTPDTRFHLGSITKTFAAATTMRMVELGLPGLEDEGRQHLEKPDLPEQSVVLRQLRGHTSELPGTCKRCC